MGLPRRDRRKRKEGRSRRAPISQRGKKFRAPKARPDAQRGKRTGTPGASGAQRGRSPARNAHRESGEERGFTPGGCKEGCAPEARRTRRKMPRVLEAQEERSGEREGGGQRERRERDEEQEDLPFLPASSRAGFRRVAARLNPPDRFRFPAGPSVSSFAFPYPILHEAIRGNRASIRRRIFPAFASFPIPVRGKGLRERSKRHSLPPSPSHPHPHRAQRHRASGLKLRFPSGKSLRPNPALAPGISRRGEHSLEGKGKRRPGRLGSEKARDHKSESLTRWRRDGIAVKGTTKKRAAIEGIRTGIAV